MDGGWEFDSGLDVKCGGSVDCVVELFYDFVMNEWVVVWSWVFKFWVVGVDVVVFDVVVVLDVVVVCVFVFVVDWVLVVDDCVFVFWIGWLVVF